MAASPEPRRPEHRPLSTGPLRMTPLREMQLVEAHRDGDPAALGELLEAYQRRVYTICFRMLRDPEDASDLTQDTLVKMLENLHKYDGRAKLSTWIIRIAMNTCISHLRKKKVRKTGNSGVAATSAGFDDSTPDSAESEPSGEPSAPRRVEQEELRAGLDKAMMSLDPEMRSVLVLRDMQGLEYEQLAEALEIPLGTVKSRLFRARAALRNALDRHLPGSTPDA